MAEAIENTDVHQIEHQEELNDSQLAAVFGIGHRILRMNGRIKGSPPLAHIRTGRRQNPWQRNQSQASTATDAVKSLIAAEAEATKTVTGRESISLPSKENNITDDDIRRLARFFGGKNLGAVA